MSQHRQGKPKYQTLGVDQGKMVKNTSNPNLLLFLLLLVLATKCTSEIVVHTINELGPGRVLNIHCELDLSTDMGTHDIPNGGSFEWKFGQDSEHGDFLECDVSTKGAWNVLHFAGYHKSGDDCTTNCDWRFTDKGVYKLVDGEWRFHYSWPH